METKTSSEEREERGEGPLGNYTQKQRTDTGHCVRSRSQQQQEEDYIPDAPERQIEEWAGHDGITVKDLKQTYRNKKNRGATNQSSLIKNPQNKRTKDTSQRTRTTRKKHTSAAVIGEKRRGNAYEKEHNINENLEK